MPRVIVPIAEGCEEIEAVSIIDVLRRGGVEVVMAAVKDELHVKGAHGISFKCDVNFASQIDETFDMIVLPGGSGGVDVLSKDTNVQAMLKNMDVNNKPIGALCAAPIALEVAGVLKENFTCYPTCEDSIRLEGFQSDTYMVVEDKNIITSRGPGTAICFALEILKRLQNEKVFNEVKNDLLVDYCMDAKSF